MSEIIKFIPNEASEIFFISLISGFSRSNNVSYSL